MTKKTFLSATYGFSQIFLFIWAGVCFGGPRAYSSGLAPQFLTQVKASSTTVVPVLPPPSASAPVRGGRAAASTLGEASLPPVHRTVIHTEAYKKREGIGSYINFKITPPEKRGRKGRLLVEVYNFSKINLAVVDFWLILSNEWGDKIEVQITCDNINAGWSALKWVQIPGNKPIPEITTVQIKNMKIFDAQGHEAKLKYFTDLIKQ